MLVLKRVAHAFGLKAHAMPLGSALQFMRLVSEKKKAKTWLAWTHGLNRI